MDTVSRTLIIALTFSFSLLTACGTSDVKTITVTRGPANWDLKPCEPIDETINDTITPPPSNEVKPEGCVEDNAD